jgi:hypothetical protein
MYFETLYFKKVILGTDLLNLEIQAGNIPECNLGNGS